MRRPLQCAAAGTALLFVTSFQLGPAVRVPPAPSLSTAAAAAACDSGFELLTAPLQRDDDGKIELKGCIFTEIQCIMVALGQRPERATDFFRWFYGDGHLIDNAGADLATKQLSKSFREALLSVCSISGGLDFQSVQTANDGTKKLLLTITNGPARGNTVETVIIPMLQGPQRKPRYTLCISSQVGCRQNCQFCFTGMPTVLIALYTIVLVYQNR
jgi:adenine C2-methylase RlmN of 23S rRNA A2503 and tRNA A37